MKRIFAGALCLIMLVLLFPTAAHAAVDTSQYDYYFTNYAVEVTANPDRSFDIVEHLDVYFNVESRGIFRDISLVGSVEAAGIENINVEGDPFTVEDGTTIRIGDPDVYLEGAKSYTISYTLTHYADNIEDYDYIYLNLLPNDATLIQNFSAVVHLPAGASLNHYELYAGRYGEDMEGMVTSEVRGNDIVITSLREFTDGESVTIEAEMLAGAFPDAPVWVPDIVVNSLVYDITIDEYGDFHVKETYSMTKNFGSSLYRSIYAPGEGYTDSRITGLTVTQPDGSVEDRSGDSYASYSLDLFDYEYGETATSTVEYIIDYDVIEGSNGGVFGVPLAQRYEDIGYENIVVNISAPYAIDTADIWSTTSSYSIDPSPSFSQYGRVSYPSANEVRLEIGLEEFPGYILDNAVAMSLAFDSSVRFARKSLATDTIVPVLAALFAALAAAFAFFINSNKPLAPAIEFYPPNGMNPADMGFIIDNKVEGRDITALIYYWASHGHLAIEMTGKSSFTLHKLGELDSGHAVYEADMFRSLFKAGKTSITSKSLENSFYSTVNSTKVKVRSSFTGARRMFSKVSLGALFGIIGPILIYSLLMMASSNYGFNTTVATTSALTLLIISFVAYGVMNNYSKQMHKGKSAGAIVVMILVGMFAIGFGYAFIRVFMGRVLPTISAVIAGVAMLGIAVIAPFARRRTEFGQSALNLTLGFKQFLETAEKQRLEMLLEQDPNYYYNILPYAQVLGVSTIWQKKFDGLLKAPPSWYYGYGVDVTTVHYMMMRSMNSVTRAITSVPQSTGSGGGGFSGGGGGGFSGGGGGGFSGGGFSGGGSGGGSVGRW